MLIRYLKSKLSVNVRAKARQWLDEADAKLAIVASHSDLLVVLYYVVVKREFLREMRSVLVARRSYYSLAYKKESSTYRLRRNIHRIEKGLIMQPMRPTFAQAYIEDTVVNFCKCSEEAVITSSEFMWSRDVLEEYFFRVKTTKIIERAKLEFDRHIREISELNCENYSQLVLSSEDENIRHSPVTYKSVRSNSVSFDAFKALCQGRYSVRWFEPKRVPKDLLDAAINVAATAPSACNRQPFKFYVFDDPVRAQEIGAIPMGTAGFSQNFQSIIVVVGDLSAYPFEKDRHIIYIDCGLAVMQLQLALETQGLASCSINWPDIERHERHMAEELSLKPYQRPVMLLAVGYPQRDALVPYSAKKTAADLIERLK
jgi:nitroreductase